jgi:5-methylcytosine-specific restriction protein A
MPFAPPKPCALHGCGELTHDRYCDRHKRQAHAEYDRQRGSASARGYGRRWQKARVAYLKAHPLCAACERAGRVTAATEVDHVRPHKGDMKIFWDHTNWQGLCHECHSRKTALEDGRWG